MPTRAYSSSRLLPLAASLPPPPPPTRPPPLPPPPPPPPRPAAGPCWSPVSTAAASFIDSSRYCPIFRVNGILNEPTRTRFREARRIPACSASLRTCIWYLGRVRSFRQCVRVSAGATVQIHDPTHRGAQPWAICGARRWRQSRRASLLRPSTTSTSTRFLPPPAARQRAARSRCGRQPARTKRRSRNGARSVTVGPKLGHSRPLFGGTEAAARPRVRTVQVRDGLAAERADVHSVHLASGQHRLNLHPVTHGLEKQKDVAGRSLEGLSRECRPPQEACVARGRSGDAMKRPAAVATRWSGRARLALRNVLLPPENVLLGHARARVSDFLAPGRRRGGGAQRSRAGARQEACGIDASQAKKGGSQGTLGLRFPGSGCEQDVTIRRRW